MMGNVAVETGLGGVPMLGDVMDMIWKANLRNLAIIDEHLVRREVGDGMPATLSKLG